MWPYSSTADCLICENKLPDEDIVPLIEIVV